MQLVAVKRADKAGCESSIKRGGSGLPLFMYRYAKEPLKSPLICDNSVRVTNREGRYAMSQISFAEAEYQNKKRKTRREKFLERIDQLIPWKKLEKRLPATIPKGENGRRPYPLQVMLRIHCMQLSYNLSDPAMEDELYEIESMRRSRG